jgi:tyrocidine synthetase-3
MIAMPDDRKDAASSDGDFAYWSQQLADWPEGIELPCDLARPAVRAPSYDRAVAQLPATVAARLRRTPGHAWSFAASAVFFGKIANAKRFVIGLAQHDGVVPVRVDLQANESFSKLLTRLDATARESGEHAITDLDAIVRKLGLQRDPARHPLFEVGFGEGEPAGDLHIRLLSDAVEIVYDANLISKTLAKSWVQSLAQVLSSVSDDPDRSVGSISLLSSEQTATLLEELCTPTFNWPKHLLLHQLFEAKADQSPNAIAVSSGTQTLTYAELEARANVVARELTRLGVGPDSIVALVQERSPEMIVGILGVLKAGGAYLPIEPDSPLDRIEYVLKDSSAKVLVTVSALASELPRAAPVVCVDELLKRDAGKPATRPTRACEPHHLAYVIYTSGSTGMPKGVLIEHRNVVHLILAEREDFGVRANDALILLSSYTFDASIDQIWLALTSGAKLVLVDKTTILDAALLTNVIAAEQVTHLDTIPSLLSGLSPEEIPSVKRVVVGGESCSVATARAWCNSVRLFNEYGPTETTVGSLRHHVWTMPESETRVPIGMSIGMTRAYVLDWGGCLVPPGIRGELYIGGAGVTRGYLNRDDLTREKFLPDPHSHDGARMYRTGDLVAWRADGSMDFFGRVDSQVKVRGFRIELGEIEAALLKHPDVTDVAVTVVGESDETRRLACHFQARRPLRTADLVEFLALSLPTYMVPSAFLQMDDLPKTVAGKVDRKKLPRIETEADGVEPPANRIELEVREIWSQLLKLPAERISVTRSFFELGGHSLLVTQLASRIQKNLGVAVRVAVILLAPTIRAIAEAIAMEGPEQAAPIKHANLGLALPATGPQRLMYVVQQANPRNASHNLPLIYEIEGELRDDVITRAFSILLERHEALRTGFFFQEGQILQKIAQNARFELEHFELEEGPSGVDKAMTAFVRPFILEEPPLFRAAVFTENGRSRFLALDMHHMITDGMSVETMLEDFIAIVEGKPLPETTLRYFDHAAWLESDAWTARVAAAKPYWMDLLRDLPVIDLPYDFPRPLTRHALARDVTLELDRTTLDAIASYCRAHESTPFAFFAGVYSLFLSSQSGSPDVVFGFPSAGRPHPDFERVVGMFVNMLVFRSSIELEQTFPEFLGQTMSQVRQALRNEDYPFEKVIDDLKIQVQPGRRPMADTMLSYEGFTPGKYPVGGAVLRERRVNLREAKDDLAVIIREAADGYTIWFEYSVELFKESTVEKFARDFRSIIDKVLANENVLLAELHTITPSERERVTQTFNATEHPLPAIGGVHELFEMHVRERPNAPAVRMRDAAWSYAEVNDRANAIAHLLREKSVDRDSIVGIVVEPSLEMLTSILGVLKSGAAFMPIDASYPLARKIHMLKDSRTRVLLTKGNRADDLREHLAGTIFDLDDPELYATPRAQPKSTTKKNDLAYVIYTSGSTGQPKGAMIEHGNIINFSVWLKDFLKITPADVISKYASFGFDSSIGEIVPAFVSGACLVIVPEEIRLSLDELDAYFAEQRITIADLPTQFGEQFLKHATKHSLRAVRVGGEKLRTVPASSATLYNEYGPTECTVISTTFPVDKSYDNVPIGKPIWNTQILILDRLGRVCPVGVPGELCIAGDGLARGYLNQPTLTAEKFVQNPLARGGRMYRTGDLARWIENGNIEFLGRIDTQVKVRGFRVELGEIEQALMTLSGIQDATVVARENPMVRGDLLLVGFVMGSGDHDEAALQAELGKTLPPYMVPTRIVRLEQMPLTANGKVDKRLLPAVELGTIGTIVEPRTPTEKLLRPLYAEVLGIAEDLIGVETNFVALGGHSLKAVVLLSAIYRQLSVQLRLASFLEASSIAKVAAEIDARQEFEEPPSSFARVPRGSELALTSSQSRILAVQQLASWSTAYNIPIAWELHKDVDLDRLTVALKELVNRHDALRASFPTVDGTVIEKFEAVAHLDVKRARVDDANVNVTLEEMVEPFDLTRAPLMRATILTTPTRKILALDLHHIIADGMSFPILLEDLEALYEGRAEPRIRGSFADYVFWEQSAEARAKRESEKTWWLEKFADPPHQLDLPYDYDRPARASFEGDEISIDIPPEMTAALLDLAKSQSVTPMNPFLAAWGLVLSRLGNSPDLVIGVPAFGRHVMGTENIVGMFVNTVPVRLKLGPDETFRDLSSRLGRETAEAFDRQAYHLSDLVVDLGVVRNASRNPLFDVVLEWQEDGGYGNDSKLGLWELPPPSTSAKFDLELTIDNSRQGQRLTLLYSTSLFSRATAQKFLSHLRRVLEQAATNPDLPMRDFRMLEPWEREMLLVDFNPKESAAPAPSTLTDWFDKQARESPHAIAVEDQRGAYTFEEVDRRASVLARALADAGVGVDDVVGLAIGRSREILVAIIGIMKSGAGYLPIEPDAPEERAAGLLADSGARMLVTDGATFLQPKTSVIRWDSLDWKNASHFHSLARPSSIAYVIYTSGSTGKPKGVVVEHASAVNYVVSSARVFGMGTGDRVLLFSSITFDASVEQIGLVLASGARLVVPSKELILDLDAFESFMAEKKVTFFHAVPLFLSSFNPKRALDLKWVISGADVCPIPVAERWSKHAAFYNEYGPTETTVAALRHAITPDDLRRTRLPIGRPAARARIYIFDWTGNLAPLGVAGEMYIGGPGVSRGYRNNAELTNDRFLANPYAHGEKFYRTGDIARWRRDGAVEFLGRADNQVKIRGFRIELGEIEAALLRYAHVAEAAVIVAGDQNDKRLCAYVVTRSETPPREIRGFVARLLPSYMVPDAVVVMDTLPVTTSGKLDRKRLPVAVFEEGTIEDVPATEAEAKLCEIWAEVLKLPLARVPVQRSFFELGGHSLLIMPMITKAQEAFGVRLVPVDIFEKPTIRELAALIGTRERQAIVRIPKLPELRSYPLSSVQRRLFAIHQTNPESISYNIPSAFEVVAGRVTRERLEEVVRALIHRHASFRTSFVIEHGEPVARVEAEVPYSLVEMESDESVEDVTEQLVQPFDLSIAPLVRVYLVRRSNGAQLVVVDIHHIVFDGGSSAILWREIHDYLAGITLAPLRIHYGDFAAWQATPEHQASLAQQRQFWLDRFATLPGPVALPYDFRRPAVRDHAGDLVSTSLSKQELDALIALSRGQDATLFVTLITAFFAFLSRIGGADDLVVGVPTSGRVHPDVHDLIGMFVNTVPWRLTVPSEGSFLEFLSTAKALSIEFLSREEYQLESLLEDLGVRAEAGHNPLFDIMFSYQAAEADDLELNAGRLRMRACEFGHRTAKMDLTLIATESDSGLDLTFEYATELFERSTVERLAGHFATLLRSILREPSRSLASLEILTQNERTEILETFNATEHALPPVASIHQLFEQWVAKTPDAECVVCADVHWTYAEVERRAEHVAAWLQTNGIVKEDRVALVLDPCADQVPAILGIMKAGAVFVPIDSSYPVGRQKFMIEDSGARALVTRDALCETLEFKGPRLDLTTLPPGSAKRAHVDHAGTDAAYIIYTSGSTGKPKGVVTEHRNLLNFAAWYAHEFGITANDSVGKYFGFSFDGSMAEQYPALISGARLVVVPAALRLAPKELSAYLAEHHVAVASFPTQFGEQFLHITENPGLRRIMLGGEKLRAYRPGPWTVVNGYGPTECTCLSTSYPVQGQLENIPVGKPVWNTQIYILDKMNRLCPVGVAGELCIGGNGVARGYLNRADLTHEKFVTDPFAPAGSGARMYRSGDIARWLPDGNIEHLGRADTQVKVRGYRIELGEIEAALLEIPGISDAVLLDGKDTSGTTRLLAYVVAANPIDVPQIQAALAKTLPEYMVPDHFHQLDELPVTTNGKVDKRALPAIELGGGDAIEAPANETEQALARIWSRVLGVASEKISVTARFVDLGGHSLKAIALMTEIYRDLGIELSVGDVFRHPTIRSMAVELLRRDPKAGSLRHDALAQIPKLSERTRYPLSSVQRRMFAIQQANPESTAYNIPSVFEVEGNITRERLVAVVRAMFERHASFRTSFIVEQGEPVARIEPEVPFALTEIKSDETIDELIARLVQPFDLAVAPLARVYWIRRSNDSEVVLVDFHHIVFDGASSSILWREVRDYLAGVTLPPLRIHYGDFAAWQTAPEHGTALAEHRQFWLDRFATLPKPIPLPYDFRRPANRTNAGDMVTTFLSKEETESLAALSRDHDSTLFVTLISAFFAFLSRIGGVDDLVVGVPTSGRAHPDVQDLIGMFVNTVPWRLTVPSEGSFLDFLATAKTASLDFLTREDYQLESIIEDLGIRGDADHNPLFDVMFAYQFDEADAIDAGQVRLHGREFGQRTAKMDLTLTASESKEGLELTFEYATELFEKATIERISSQFATLLRNILRAPSAPITSLEILSAAERTQLVDTFNATHRDLPNVPVHQLFEAWVARTPNAEAVVCRDVHWTYAEVERRAEIIAAWLQEQGVTTDDRVAIVLDPCADQLPAILGVHKAGAAFVPIDASYPAARQSYMIADSVARALVTRGDLADPLGFTGPRLDLNQLPNTLAPKRAPVKTKLTDAAYVIYTSGSTGKPKGVVVEHTSLLNLALWSADDNAVQPGDSLSRYFGFSFDPTMSEVFPACISGARLVVVPGELRLDPKGLSAYLAEHHVAIAAFPTQFGEQFLLITDNPGFRRVTLCGEKLRAHRSGPWTMVNGYGPTETTCYSSSFVVDKPYDNIPIGKPLWNTQILVLDQHKRLCPIGVAGELCIAGKGVARGYLNKPELTQERFVPHPFASPGDGNERMYRTGDVARWLPDGNIEYLGRVDKQVKVRGYRVELGEIEAALLAIAGIEDAAVIDVAEESGATALVAYVVSKTPIDVPQIQATLAKSLPEYIVPGYFMQMSALPLTPNGKVDRRALPSIEVGDGAAIEPPAGEMEHTLVRIWSRVLGVDQDKLSVTTHFVDLGGHSLKAISLVTEIYRELAVELKVGDVFRHPTVRAMAVALTGRAPAAPLPPIERAEPADSYPASSVQERMFFLQQVDPSGVSYNLASLFALDPSVRKEDVARALGTLAKRHGAFRCSFELVGTSPRVRLAPSVELPLVEIKTTEALREATIADLTRPFDLSIAPLARAAWVATEQTNYLFFDIHHSVTDGTSTQLLLDELSALLRGETLPEVGRNVVDCAVWERSEAALAISAKQREHWKNIFADGVPALELVTDFPRPPVASPEGATATLDLSETTLRALKSLGQRNGFSLYNLCLAAFNVFLGRITRQEEIVVGTPVSGRWHPDMQNVCGMFVNTLVLGNKPDPSLPFLDFVREVTRRSLEALDNQAFPFADLVEMIGGRHRADRNPLFDVMLVVNEAEDRLVARELLTPIAVDAPYAKFDLTFAVDEAPDHLGLTLEYRTSLFRRSTIETFLRSLRALFEDIAARPTASIGSLTILATEDRQRVQIEFNQTTKNFPREHAVQELFENAAAKNPSARALVDGDHTYTYGEVDACANRLAHRLIGMGVGRESIVGVLSDPTCELFIAELAILKAGAAFLPLDHRYPRERLEFTLRDSGAQILLAAENLDTDLEWPGRRLALGKSLFAEGPTTKPATDPKETDLAYVIYTSGSTGRPKGVAIEHRSLVNYVHRSIDCYGLGPSDRLTKYAGISFDASVMETFPALCSGAELHLVPDAVRLSPPDLATWMQRSQVTWSFLPTQLGEEFMRDPRKTNLRWLVVGGDRLRKFSPASFSLVNEYGPTEFTVSATTFFVDRQSDNIPIGKPNPNTKIFVLDSQGDLCPPGVPGEICLVGAGMARGYIGAPELTAKKFVSHPLADGERMYRTGDLGRWRDDGNLEFLGRIDSQVKIRGFRIELGEIEQAILEIPGVTGCVTIDLPDDVGDRMLCGYFVSSEDVTPTLVRQALARRLPDYMVPVALVRIPEIPFTTSGKVDRHRLPAPELQRAARSAAPAENIPQALVLSAFERVLGLTNLQVDDDFFDLGGNSLKAIAAVAVLANDFRINANDLFRLRTARNVAAEIPVQRGDLKARLEELAESLRDETEAKTPREITDAIANYRARTRPYESIPLTHRETYRNILLTGATGFLGCYLLRDLIQRTDAKIYVAVRAKTRKEAWDRLTSRADYYFGEGTLQYVRRRIIVVPSYLEQPQLGLDDGTFDQLARTIDCVLHAAALTKHYGDYSAFVAANVDATNHLIALARKASCPFNLISTMSVANGEIDGVENAIFTEFNCDIGQRAENHYVRTKLAAEKAAMDLRSQGLVANLFRVGFLTGDSQTLRFQQNADDSGFVQKLRSFVELGAMPAGALVHSFCPVNEVSDAIVRLMFASALQNETHHIERFTDAADAERIAFEATDVDTMEDADFYEWLAARLEDPNVTKAATAMLLHQGLLDDGGGTETLTLRERSDLLLARLGFTWSAVTPEQVWSLLDPSKIPAPMRDSIRLRIAPTPDSSAA